MAKRKMKGMGWWCIFIDGENTGECLSTSVPNAKARLKRLIPEYKKLYRDRFPDAKFSIKFVKKGGKLR